MAPRARVEKSPSQGGEEVGHRLQRADDVLAHGEGEAEPAEDHHEPEGPLFLRLVGVHPEQPEGADDGGQAPEQGVVEHALFVGGAASGLRH